MRRASGVWLLSVILLAGLGGCGSSPNQSTTPSPLIDVSTITLNPDTIPGGMDSTATVTLTIASPAGGTKVALVASSRVVTIPTTVVVPAGSTTTTFKITTNQVGSTQVISIAASLSILTAVQASLTVTPVTPINVTALTVSSGTVPSGSSAIGTVTISAPAFTPGQPVSLTSNSPLVTLPSPVVVPAGFTSVNFQIFTSAVNAPTVVTITANLHTTVNASLTLGLPQAQLSNLIFSPSVLVGGTMTTGTVLLSQLAPTGGTVVTLVSGNITVAPVPTGSNITIPPNATRGTFDLTIPAGATQGTFTVNTTAVGTSVGVLFGATLNGAVQTFLLGVTPPISVSGLTLSPAATTGGLTSTGQLTINSLAPQGGTVVPLTNSNPGAVTVPASVTVPSGSTLGIFNITTLAVTSTQTATITATLGGTETATLTVNPASGLTVSSLVFSASPVLGGQPSMGTLTLSGPAPPAGSTVTLASSDPAVTVPASVMVLAGTSSATFTATTSVVAMQVTATITATINAMMQTAMLVVVPSPAVASLVLNPTSVAGGNSSQATVTLSAAAPSGGTIVMLSSSDPSVQLAPSVTVAAGATTATFTVTTLVVTSPISAVITATVGASSQQATLSVTLPPPVPRLVFFNPATVTGGQTAQGTVVVTQAAPMGGTVVTLSSSSTSVTVPGTVTVPQGSKSVTFSATASSVSASTTVTVTATLNSATQTITLTVIPVVSGTLSEQILSVGSTTSTDFPVTAGAFQNMNGGVQSGTLTSLQLSTTSGNTTMSTSFSTYFGASAFGDVRDVFIDPAGNVFACGVTKDAGLPTTAGVVQRVFTGSDSNAFVVEFSSTGTVKFLTYYGGSQETVCYSILVDSTGNIFIAGRTSSPDFPVSANAFQKNFGGGTVAGGDMFIAKLASGAVSTTWATYIGGSGDDAGSGRLGLDTTGNVYLSGVSQSTTDFPTGQGQGQPNLTGVASFGVVVKLSTDGTTLLSRTILAGKIKAAGASAGPTTDASGGLVVNSSGSFTVCGFTNTTDIGATTGAFQTAIAGKQDAFVAQYSSSGVLTALTYVGGSGNLEACKGLAVDSAGNVILVTPTDSADYPNTTAATLNGPSDIGVTKLTADLSLAVFSTLLGGSVSEIVDGTRLELDASENLYFSLSTNSGDFPVTPNATHPMFTGLAGGANNNVAIVKFAADGSKILFATYLGGSANNSSGALRYHKN